MVQIDPRPGRGQEIRLEDAADVVGEGMARARKAAVAAAEHAQDAMDDAAGTLSGALDDIDPADVEVRARDLFRRLGRIGASDSSEVVTEARDRERLRSALVAGVVVFVLGAIAFVVAREIARRRTTAARRPGVGGSSGKRDPSAADVAEAR